MAKSDSPLVSVIVPVYNVEKYIDDCLISIVNQSYKNIEIILVDDASPDKSSEKCDKWAGKDKRISVIHKTKNEGLNFARRDGLRSSSGDWISFVDSDDIVHGDLIKDMLDAALMTKTDIVVARNQKFEKKSDISFDFSGSDSEMSVLKNKTQIMRYVLVASPDDKVFMVTAWCKLFNRTVLESIDWDLSNSRANEDELEAIQYFSAQSRGVAVLKKTLYFYRDNPTSIMNKPYHNSYNKKNYSRFEWIEELYKITANYLSSHQFADELLYHNVMLNLLFFNKDLYRGAFTDEDYEVFRKNVFPKLKEYKKISKKYPLKFEEKRIYEHISDNNIFKLWTADKHLINKLHQEVSRISHESALISQDNIKLREDYIALHVANERLNSRIDSLFSIRRSFRLLLGNIKRRIIYGRKR